MTTSRTGPGRERARPAEPREPEPPVLALQRAAGNQAVTRLLGDAMDADFSDVRLRPDSDRASAIGARAFAEGSEVHFAPGEFRPGQVDGLELIGHELAHVVQQREGRATAGDVLASGDLADRSPELEAEAEMHGRLAARGLRARRGKAFSAPGPTRPVVQGVFTAAAEIVPTVGTAAPVGPETITVDELVITDKKRPPTRIEGSQGRHTVAWQAKVRFWQAHFAEVTVADALARLDALARSDDAVDAGQGSEGAAGTEARALLLQQLTALRRQDATRTPAEWVRMLEWALTTYAKAYQSSSFAAFRSINPKGRNEAGHLKALTEAEGAIAEGKTPTHDVKIGKRKKARRDMAPADVLARARGLLDLSPQAQPAVLHKVFGDWLKVIDTLYPKLFEPGWLRRPGQDEIDAILTEGYPRVLALFARMAGTDTVPAGPPEPEGKAVPEPDEEVTEEQTDPGEAELSETEPFLIAVRSRQTADDAAVYRVGQVSVTNMIISDERPPTQFGARQMSHTIPWTLSRNAWLREFGHGRRLADVVESLQTRLAEDAGWSVGYTDPSVVAARAELAAKLAGAGALELAAPDWSAWLSDAVETYVYCYEAAPFASFGTEPAKSGDSSARGRGEAAAMRTLDGWESAMTEDPLPANEEIAPVAKQLIEVPGLDTSRAMVDLAKLETRWLADMRARFPHLMKHRTKGFEDAWKMASVQDDRAMEINEIVNSDRTTRSKRKASA